MNQKMQLLPPFLLLFTLSNAAVFGSEAVAYVRNFQVLRIESTIVVDKAGRGNFQTVQAAVDSVPSYNNKWIKIQINPGVYKEKVTIPGDKPYIFLDGDDRRTTFITFDDHQSTDLSATFTSMPDNIVARGITFENSFNLAEAPQLYDYEERTYITQAVAARIFGDRSAFFDCGFMGFQDTLWDVQGRHLFENCYIEGAIDFIFGRGQSIYKDCLINVNVASLPQVHQGYITAQGRESEADPSGFIFKQCNVTGAGQVLLGRAYRPYSRVIFEDTTLGSVVAPEGWDAWSYKGQEENFMYVEVNGRGPGSSTSKRVPWEKKLGASELRNFSMAFFINQDGWIPTIP